MLLQRKRGGQWRGGAELCRDVDMSDGEPLPKKEKKKKEKKSKKEKKEKKEKRKRMSTPDVDMSSSDMEGSDVSAVVRAQFWSPLPAGNDSLLGML